ncbi:MAG: hypothetical protein EAX96_11730 [Candidatus Lokiarchaeota archaeon]|nr:hypothetical protein [Candidatus Lokiarchaeota archaeon]
MGLMKKKEKQTDEMKKSSFERGIEKKLENNFELLEWLTGEYIVSVNSKWSSNDFPSSQLAKMILKILNKGKTNFSVFHRLVKEILKEWEVEHICSYVTTTKYAHSRKTKMIFRFDEEGIKKLKEKIMSYSISLLEKQDVLFLKIVRERETMKTREKIIDLSLMDIENLFLDFEKEEEEF